MGGSATSALVLAMLGTLLRSEASLTAHHWDLEGGKHRERSDSRPKLLRSGRLRGGSDVQMLPRLEVQDDWDMLTKLDGFGMNVTVLQCRAWPFCIIELWWESLGRFRFSYDDEGEDVMCAFPQASTSNSSAWDIDELIEELKDQRGMAPVPDLPLELGMWKIDKNVSCMLITNKFQPDMQLFLTQQRFYFFGTIGYALKLEGDNQPPTKVRSVEVCEEVGLKRENQKLAAEEEEYVFPPKHLLDLGYS